MQRKIFIVLLMSLSFILLPFLSVFPQSDKSRANLVVRSQPSGALIYLEGEYDFVGRTPFVLPQNLIGTYKIKAIRNGYENWSSYINLTGDQKATILIRLSPKTKFKAAIRSLVFPGWGQIYSDRQTRGIILSFVQAGVTFFAVKKYYDYQDAIDQYNEAVSEYESHMRVYEEREKYWNVLQDRDKDVNNADRERKTWAYIAAGLWFYNFLDAILFFPSYERSLYYQSTPAISARIVNGTPTLALSIPF